jgi:hypothetical protein
MKVGPTRNLEPPNCSASLFPVYDPETQNAFILNRQRTGGITGGGTPIALGEESHCAPPVLSRLEYHGLPQPCCYASYRGGSKIFSIRVSTSGNQHR